VVVPHEYLPPINGPSGTKANSMVLDQIQSLWVGHILLPFRSNPRCLLELWQRMSC
jgi:hypothetical protein